MESLKKPIKKLFASLSALSLILALTLTATASAAAGSLSRWTATR